MNVIRYGKDGLLSTVQDTMAGSKSPSIMVEFLQIVEATPIRWKFGNRGLNAIEAQTHWAAV